MTDSLLPEIDMEAQDDLRDALGDEDFDGLVSLFKNSLPDRLREIAAAITAGDAVTMARASHAMKGAAANLGYVGLSELFCTLERKGKSGELSDAAPLCEQARAGAAATFPDLVW